MPHPYDLVPFSYTGTGAALNVPMYTTPRLIVAFNNTDGDTLWFWYQGMAADTGITSDAAVGTVASGGCTVTRQGFTLGTNAKMNESGKAYLGFALL
jgi:hypothetical protein